MSERSAERSGHSQDVSEASSEEASASRAVSAAGSTGSRKVSKPRKGFTYKSEVEAELRRTQHREIHGSADAAEP